MNEFQRDALIFEVRDDGPPDGDAVVLLHGFPETKESWDAVIPALTGAGYRVLAPDQRGYSPRARPKGRWAYRPSQLVHDVLAMANAAGVERFHVVGHDHGGAVAWGLATTTPGRIKSLAVLSTPHPRAMVRSMFTSRQALQSWYMLAFQLPILPELMVGTRLFRRQLAQSGLPPEKADIYLSKLGSRQAMAGPINWYRGLPFVRPDRALVSVPTMYVYSTGDVALGRKAADLTRKYVAAPYRYEILDGVSHWIPEEAPAEVSRLLLEHFAGVS